MRAGVVLAALVATACAVLLVAPPAVDAAQARLRVTSTPVREQEPLAPVRVPVRVTNAAGRGVSGVRCVFSWRQGGRLLYRKAAATASSGRTVDRRVVRRATAGKVVRVLVRCRVRGMTLRTQTCFVPQQALPASPKVLFVGDSLTAGLYATTQASSFAGLVAAALPCATTATIATVGGRSDGVDLRAVSRAASDICVIELGTNDASGYPRGVAVKPATFADNLRAVVRTARAANPTCRIVFVSVWQYRHRRAPYDAEIAALSLKLGRHVVDIGSIKDDPQCKGPRGVATVWGVSDNWHPNDAGHAAIAARVEKLILRLLRLSGVSPEAAPGA